jgi:hypothetical protein
VRNYVDLLVGVDDSGEVQDPHQGVETYYRTTIFIAANTGGFVSIIMDDGGTNLETRIPFGLWMACADAIRKKRGES